MARGKPENFVRNETRTPEELRKITQKGGIASGKARRLRKAMRETLLELLKMPATERKEYDFETAGLLAMLEKWEKGDVAAGVFVRDTIGEKPVEKRDVALQAEISLTKEQRDAAYRGAMLAAQEEDDLK